MNAALRRAPSFLELVRTRVPPCVVHAVVTSWFNGWCTTRRFQLAVIRCRARPECDGRDELEHYAVCRHLRQCAEHFLGIPHRPASLGKFLGVDRDPAEGSAAAALHAYAALAVFNSVHHGNHVVTDTADLLHLYRQGLRHAATVDGRLVGLIPRL